MNKSTDTGSSPEERSVPDDSRPRFSICHVGLTATDTDLLADFYNTIGMRLVGKRDGLAVLELRGGTHLVITRGQPGTTKLDLMVDDLDETHVRFNHLGARPSTISHGNPHSTFTATDPEGNGLLIESSHTTGPV